MTLKHFNNDKEKRGVLQEARNKYGSFKVATHYVDERWSKHIDVLEIWETEEWWRLEKANNRTIFESEIVLDLDPEKGESIKQTKEKAKEIWKVLKKHNFQFKCFFSGSRGYHFHLIFPELSGKKYYYKKIIRELFIDILKCDLMKASDNTMIAMEHTPHWKTGKKKVEVLLDVKPIQTNSRIS